MPFNDPPSGMSDAVLDFRARTLMPEGDVDALFLESPGFLEAQLAGELATEIVARLRKRYATPFNPVPEIVKFWLARLVTPQAYLKRGRQPSDPTMASVEKDRDNALAQIKEAADAVDGLFDLPLREDKDGSAIAKGEPLTYSEASPYDWMDVQAEAVRDE